MESFYKKRLSLYQRKMFRYLKYVFNDHISFIMIFVLGGFMFYYTELIKQVSAPFYLGKLFIGVLWFVLLFVGKLATIVEEADKVFLLPKEKELGNYLKEAYKHSLSLPFVLLALVAGISFPLLMVASQVNLLDMLFFVLMLWCLKGANLFLHLSRFYQNTESLRKSYTVYFVLVSLTSIATSLLAFSWLGMIIAVAFLILIKLRLTSELSHSMINWEALMDSEKTRQKKIYQFINLFTDVPGITSSVKRRKYLDGFLKKIKPNRANTYLYLYARSFLRGSEYSGIYVRLIIVAAILILFLKSFIWGAFLSVLVLFLICFQLLPLYNQFEYMVMTQLYPLSETIKKKNLQTLLSLLMGIACLIMCCLGAIALGNLKMILLTIGVNLFMTVFLIFYYVPTRINKMKKY